MKLLLFQKFQCFARLPVRMNKEIKYLFSMSNSTTVKASFERTPESSYKRGGKHSWPRELLLILKREGVLKKKNYRKLRGKSPILPSSGPLSTYIALSL